MTPLSEICDFLLCDTPDSWIGAALAHPDILLIDHANCEKKAASTAMNLMYRYIDRPELLNRMSKLAREELRHFEQVLAIMKKRRVPYVHVSPSRYAGGLREGMRTHDPAKLIDTLIVGAIIEARSCERFAKLAPHLDPELEKFYTGLLASEGRHYQNYLKLAYLYADQPFDDRIEHFLRLDQQLIESPDTEFRFHSGVPLSGGGVVAA